MKRLLLLSIMVLGFASAFLHAATEVTIEEEITGLYVAYFNRAADEGGLTYWTQRGEEAQQNGEDVSDVLKQLSAGFAQHPSFARAYGDMDNQAFVEAVYRNTLGRDGDAQGVNYWTGLLNGGMSRSDFVSIFVDAALTFDRTDPQYAGLSQEDLDAAQLRQDLISNKVEVALAFTHQLGVLSNVSQEHQNDPESDPAYLASIKIISEISENYSSVVNAEEFLDSIVSSSDPISSINNAVSIIANDLIKSFAISSETPVVEDDKSSIKFSIYSIDEESNLTIRQKPFVIDNDDNITALEQLYELSLGEQHQFIDPVEMTFVINDSMIDGVDDISAVISAWYNDSDTNESLPVDYLVDDINKTITIMTTHFSSYAIKAVKGSIKKGPFKLLNEHTRYARILDVNPYYPLIHSDQAKDIITQSVNDMEMSDNAFESAFSASNNWLGFSASGNTLASSAYSSKVLDNLTQGFNKVGVLAAVVQAGVDFQNGDTQALYTNLLKNGVYNTVNFVGTSALQLAFVGVFAIDYSINAFASEAWDGSNEKWFNVYKHCYNKHFKKNAVQWYKKFYWIWHDAVYSQNPQSMSTIQATITQEILDNVWAVWNELSAESLSECVDDLGYTNLGGLNDDIKSKLALAKRAELVSYLNPVFLRLQRPINYKIREDYHNEWILLKAYLNQFVKIRIIESVADGKVSKYAGYHVKFSPLSNNTNQSMWIGTLPKGGDIELNTRFTLLAHLQAGSPYSLELFKPEDDPKVDTPVKTVDFTISMPEITIELGEGVEGGVTTELSRCPAKQSGAGALIVDQTHHKLYADLQEDYWDVRSAIANQKPSVDYFVCIYSDYQDELYYAYYYEKAIPVLSQEWYNSDLPERSARLKYETNFKTKTYKHYEWSWESDEDGHYHWIYELTESGSI